MRASKYSPNCRWWKGASSLSRGAHRQSEIPYSVEAAAYRGP
jgi:hypothetical protein